MADMIKKLITNLGNYSENTNSCKYIVIHDTANEGSGADGMAHYNYFQTKTTKTSAHYIVDDKQIVQIIEDIHTAYHCGDRHNDTINNSNSIGIEICVNSDGNFEKAVENAIYLTRLLMGKHNIPGTRVVRHYDVTGKICPRRMIEVKPEYWNTFKEQIGKNSDISIDEDNDPTKITTLKGVVLHADPNIDIETTASDYVNQMKQNTSRVEQMHYVIDNTKHLNPVSKDTRVKHCKDGKQSYISSSLYKSNPNRYTVGVMILNPAFGDFNLVEKNLMIFLYNFCKTNKLTHENIWREYDLNYSNSPWMYVFNDKWNDFISRIQNYLKMSEAEFFKAIENYESTYKESADLDKAKNDIINDFDKVATENPISDRDIEAAKNPSLSDGLSSNIRTKNRNNIYITSSQENSSSNHCSTNYDNSDIKLESDPLKVEPIYPDLIVPPIYETADNNESKRDNYIPSEERKKENLLIDDLLNPNSDSEIESTNNNSILSIEDYIKRQNIFNAKLMSANKKDPDNKDFFGKQITGKPVNNNDPYPVDDKIRELESHMPKVKIDKIHYNLSDCNHPGCKIGNPLMKNLLMMSDALTSQSKRAEARLVRIENVLSTVMRNLFRLSSRVNINCVYYGGQDSFGKYECIRCMHADRIDDGGVMTIDQCMSCSRYEPILGQIYDILDETGSNSSIILDNAQMSYMTIDDYIKFTRTEEMMDTEDLADLKNTDNLTSKSFKDMWPEGFTMDFEKTQLETHEPNINMYDLESIKQKKSSIKDKNNKEYIEVFDDTRGSASSYEENIYDSSEYSSINFGSTSSIFDTYNSINSSNVAREKIIEKAKEITALGSEGKARYSQSLRTKTIDGILYHDCSSFARECYKNAGISIGGWTGEQYPQCISTAGGMVFKDKSKALPGDLIFFATNYKATDSDLNNPNKINSFGIYHVAVYGGGDKMYEAATDENPVNRQVLESNMSYRKDILCFARPKGLVDIDKSSASGMGIEEAGKVDNIPYVYKFPKAVCTSYTESGGTAGGIKCDPSKSEICAAHGIPYGTKIYIPSIKGVVNPTGILTVMDTGGPFFDFDINTYAKVGKVQYDAYVLEWGTGKVAYSFKDAIAHQKQLGQWEGPNQFYKKAYDNWADKFSTINFDYRNLK